MESFVLLVKILLKYGPLVWEAIREGRDAIIVHIKLKDYDQAAGKAETEKDQRDLENIFKPDRHPKP